MFCHFSEKILFFPGFTLPRCSQDYDTLFSALVKCSRDYGFHSRDYDPRLVVKPRRSRDYDTLFSALVQCSRDYDTLFLSLVQCSHDYDPRLAVKTRHSRDL